MQAQVILLCLTLVTAGQACWSEQGPSAAASSASGVCSKDTCPQGKHYTVIDVKRLWVACYYGSSYHVAMMLHGMQFNVEYVASNNLIGVHRHDCPGNTRFALSEISSPQFEKHDCVFHHKCYIKYYCVIYYIMCYVLYYDTLHNILCYVLYITM